MQETYAKLLTEFAEAIIKNIRLANSPEVVSIERKAAQEGVRDAARKLASALVKGGER